LGIFLFGVGRGMGNFLGVWWDPPLGERGVGVVLIISQELINSWWLNYGGGSNMFLAEKSVGGTQTPFSRG